MVETGQLNIPGRATDNSSGGGSNTINRTTVQQRKSSPDDKMTKMVADHEARIAQLEKEIEELKAALGKTK